MMVNLDLIVMKKCTEVKTGDEGEFKIGYRLTAALTRKCIRGHLNPTAQNFVFSRASC